MPQAVLPVLEARHTSPSAPSVWMGQKTQQIHQKGHAPDRVTDTALMAEQLEHTTACILACLELCLGGWIWHKAANTF